MAKKPKSLNEQVAARICEAERKKIGQIAWTIASALGTHRSLNEDRVTGDEYTFERSGLKIHYSSGTISGSDGDAWFCGTKIFFSNALVFHQGGGTIYSYIPGAWEKKLVALHAKAVIAQKKQDRKKEKEAAAAQAKKDGETRAHWGL